MPRIVIIGGGISGLAAAEELFSQGFTDIQILEATSRVGGRINTVELDDKDCNVIDLGATFIHGKKGNPVYAIAKEEGLIAKTGQRGRSCKSVYITENGQNIERKTVAKVNAKFEEVIENASKFMSKAKDSPDIHESLESYVKNEMDKYLANFEKSERMLLNSILLSNILGECSYSGCDHIGELSLKEYGGFDELDGANFTFTKGYISFINILMQKIPQNCVLFNHSVEVIHWDNNQENGEFEVKIECENGEVVYANQVIVTVSLGVLKASHGSLFKPNLPTRKSQAIERLGFGVVDKVIVLFEEPVFGSEVGQLYFLWDANKDEMRKTAGWCRKMYNLSALHTNCVIGWVTGKEALEMELLTDEEVISDVVNTLRIFLKREDIPRPVKLFRSTWGKNKATMGSYSFIKVGSTSEDTLALQEPVMDPSSNSPRLLFAGEATHVTFYSTTHGALQSGYREAKRIVDLYQK